MSTPLAPDATWALLERLRDCLCEQLSGGDPNVDYPPCRCSIVVGEVAPDECCCRALPGGSLCCGMAWVRCTGSYPSTVFPTPDGQAQHTIDSFAAILELGVLRCAPGPDDHGQPPTVDELEEVARQVHVDAKSMRMAVRCCFTANSRNVLLGAWQPVGPEGACVGGVLTITVRVSVSGALPT
jgi:hypothetical protein